MLPLVQVNSHNITYHSFY